MNRTSWLKYGIVFFVADTTLSFIGFVGLSAGFYFLAYPLIIINPTLATSAINLGFINYLTGMSGIFIWPIAWFIIGAVIGKLKSNSQGTLQ